MRRPTIDNNNNNNMSLTIVYRLKLLKTLYFVKADETPIDFVSLRVCDRCMKTA